MRFRLLVLLCLYAGLIEAQEWTGVEVEFANVESDWKFDDGVRQADTNSISFRIEGKTETGLRIGGGIGYLSTRVDGSSSADTRRFDAQYFEIYLRQEIPVSNNISLLGGFDFRYNTGGDDDEIDRADIEWTENSFQLGVSVRFANFRIIPYVAYYDIDGDISDDSGTNKFELDDPISHGVRFDIFTEETAFIRLEVQSGDQAGGGITFVRRY